MVSYKPVLEPRSTGKDLAPLSDAMGHDRGSEGAATHTADTFPGLFFFGGVCIGGVASADVGFGFRNGQIVSIRSLGTERTRKGWNPYPYCTTLSTCAGQNLPFSVFIRPDALKHRSKPTRLISSSGRMRPSMYAFRVGATSRLASYDRSDDTCRSANLSEHDLLRVASASARAGLRRTIPRREK
jgi:hypothetical protein